jgi:hypothetical protein
MPVYEDAAYGGETVAIENPGLRVEIHKRLTGWGWAEVFAPSGRLMAVLDHFGEVKIPGLDVPLRMEAAQYQLERASGGQRLTFPVRLTTLNEMVAASEFKRFVKSPFNETAMAGTAVITLATDRPLVRVEYRFRLLADLGVSYLRGPWLKVGANSFGAAKDDGIFPGVEWLKGDEWSSGTDWFQHPWALRVAPDPFKVSVPVMAISHQGEGVGLAWNPLAPVVSHQRYPQPVFASPNFVDRRNNHLMGLMLPLLERGQPENALEADPPLWLRINDTVAFEAEILLVKGNSLSVVVDWVRRHGLPEPPQPRYALPEALERIARAYNSNLWYEGRGWGGARLTGIMGEPRPIEPEFLERYMRRNPNGETARALAEKLAWVRTQPGSRKRQEKEEESAARGEHLLSEQRADGSFPFDPDGRHSRPNHMAVAAGTCKPLGAKGDTALDLCMQPARDLFLLARKSGNPSFLQAACRALEYCLPMNRPEGGDWWETPLHSPNLLAAGNAAIAYYLGYQAVNEPRYLEKAVYWIRALLPFTHLWQPSEVPQLYNTKPCFTGTCWWLSNWVTNHVQWEALSTFAASHRLGIDWGKIDPEIDWHTYQKGITVAVLRWMIDHGDEQSLEKISFLFVPLEQFRTGTMDAMYHDSHDCTAGTYRGGPLMPDVIAVNLLNVLEREGVVR